MKVFLILLFTVLAVSAVSVEEQWKHFKENNGKQYKSLLEDKKRFEIFKENMNRIVEHNKQYELGKVSYKLALNKFADLTEEEFKSRLNPHPPSSLEVSTVSTDVFNSNIPDEIDWREKGAVTKVKDQSICGGCWAFGATGALEGQHFIKTGELLSLSEQYLIDCSDNNGCRGGWVEKAYRYIRDEGIVTEDEYPYEAGEYTCRANGTLFKDIGIVTIQQDENLIKAAVAKIGPVAVSIDASYLSFYGGGVFDNTDCSSTFTNHAVLIVGYGTTADGLDYWEVKNSWGPTWGIDGYVKMSRNKNNQCAIASEAVYPILK